MADEVFSIGYKIDSAGVEGDAEAAGKAAKSGFEKGFGTLDLKTPFSKALNGEGGKGGVGDQFALAVDDINKRLAGIKLPPLGGSSGENPFNELLKHASDTADKVDAAFAKIGKLGPGGGEGPGERIAKGSEVAVRSLGTLRSAVEGIAGVMLGGGLGGGVRSLEEFSEKATETAKAGGLLGTAFERNLPVIAATGATILTAATAGYEMAKSGNEARLELESLSKASGLTGESMVKLRGMFKGSGVDLDELDRGFANLAGRMQGARAVIARRVAEEPLETADAQDAVTLARVRAAVVRATATARDQIAAQQGPLDVVKATLGLDEATQARQQHEDEAPHQLIAARARAAVEAATGAARDQIEEQRVDLGVASAAAAAQSHAEHAPLNIAGAQLRIQQAATEQQIGAIQGPLTVEGAQITAEGAEIQASRAALRYRQFMFGERPDPARVQQLNRAAASQAYDAAQFQAKQAEANVGKASLEEENRPAAAAQQMAEAVQQLRDLFRNQALERREDALRQQEARTQQQAVQAERGAGVGWQDRLAKANEDQVHLQTQLVNQAHSDATNIQQAILNLGGARANLAGQRAGVGAGGGAAGGLTPEDQQKAAGRGETKAGLALAALPQEQIGPLAGAILTGEGPEVAGANEGLLLPALMQAGQAFGGGIPGTMAAMAAFAKREPNNPAVQKLLQQLFPRVNPLDRPNIGTRLGEVGPEGVLAGQAAPLSEGGRKLLDEDALKQAQANEKAQQDLRDKQNENNLDASKNFTGLINNLTEGLAKGVGALGPTGETVGGAALGGGLLYGALRGGGALLGGLFGGGAGAAAGGAAAGAATGGEVGSLGGPLGIAAGVLVGAILGVIASKLAGGGDQKPEGEKPAPGPQGEKPAPGPQGDHVQPVPAAVSQDGLAGAAGALSGAAGQLSGAAGQLSGAASALSSAKPEAQAAAPAVPAGTTPVTVESGGRSRTANVPVEATEQAAGGLISGSGDDTSDSIPIWASPHEYVIKASSVRKLGVPLLDRLNSGFTAGGLIRGFAEGGDVGDDDERQIALHRAQLFSVPAAVIAALARGTMADVRLLDQGLGFVGNGIISGTELAARVVATGWQDWLQQTMKEAPHQFSTPPPKPAPASARAPAPAAVTLRGKPAELVTINGVTGVMDNGFLVAPDNPRDKIEDRVDPEVLKNLAASFAARMRTAETAGGFADVGGRDPRFAPTPRERGPETVGQLPHPRTTVQVYRGGQQEPQKYDVGVAEADETEATEKARGFTYQGTPAIDVSRDEYRRPDEPASRFADIDLTKPESHRKTRIIGATLPDNPVIMQGFESSRQGLGGRSEILPVLDYGALYRGIRFKHVVSPDEAAVNARVAARERGQPVSVGPEHGDEGFAPSRRSRSRRSRDYDPDATTLPGGGLYSMGGLIPARVSNGEYRMGAGAVSRLGVGFMNDLNSGRFAEGGPISRAAVGAVGQQTGALAQVLSQAGVSPSAFLSSGLAKDGASSTFAELGMGPQSGLVASLQVARALGSTAEHTLDLVTHAGQFTVNASNETMEAIRASALGAKLTSTGTRPSWYS